MKCIYTNIQKNIVILNYNGNQGMVIYIYIYIYIYILIIVFDYDLQINHNIHPVLHISLYNKADMHMSYMTAIFLTDAHRYYFEEKAFC